MLLRHTACGRPGTLPFGSLLPLVALALAGTLATFAASSAGAALASRALRAVVMQRQARARQVEAEHLGALAQRWLRSPAVLGGSADPAASFRSLTVAALGLRADPRHPDVRHTATGTYRLIPVAPCAMLCASAARVRAEASVGGGLLVVGTGGAPDAAVAVLVLGPLVQIPLPAVPWAWVRALTTPASDPLATSEAPTEVPPARAVRPPDPQRARRMPSWRSPKPTTRRRDTPASRRAAERPAV